MLVEVFADEQTTLKIMEQNPYCEVCEQVQKVGMQQVQIKDLKKGDVFRRKADAKTVYVKGAYVRYNGWNRYSCFVYMDINREIFLKGTTKVWKGFTF